MIEIKEYDNKYADAMSKIIIQNLLEVNSKDYGLEFVRKSVKEFTPEEIKKNLIDSFEINWKANVKARFHSQNFENKYRKRGEEKMFRAQQEMYKYYQNKIEVISEII